MPTYFFVDIREIQDAYVAPTVEIRSGVSVILFIFMHLRDIYIQSIGMNLLEAFPHVFQS